MEEGSTQPLFSKSRIGDVGMMRLREMAFYDSLQTFIGNFQTFIFVECKQVSMDKDVEKRLITFFGEISRVSKNREDWENEFVEREKRLTKITSQQETQITTLINKNTQLKTLFEKFSEDKNREVKDLLKKVSDVRAINERTISKQLQIRNENENLKGHYEEKIRELQQELETAKSQRSESESVDKFKDPPGKGKKDDVISLEHPEKTSNFHPSTQVELDKKQNEISHLRKLLEEYTSENRKIITKMGEKALKFRNQKKQLEDKIQNLEEEVILRDIQAASLKESDVYVPPVETSDVPESKLRNVLEKLKGSYELKYNDLEDLKRKTEHERRELGELKGEHGRVSEMVSKLKFENVKLEERVKEERKRYDNDMDELRKNQSVEVTENMKREYEMKCQELEDLKLSHDDRVKKLTRKLGKYKRMKSSVKKEKAVKERYDQKLEDEKRELADEIERLKSEVDQLQKSKTKVVEKVVEVEVERKEKSPKRTLTKTALIQKRKARSGSLVHRGRLATKENTKEGEDGTSKQLQFMKLKFNKLKQTYQKMKREKEGLEKKVAALQGGGVVVVEEAPKAKAEPSESPAGGDSDEKVEKLKGKVENLEEELRTKSEQFSDLGSRFDEKVGEIDKLNEKIETLGKTIETRNEKISEFETLRSMLEKDVAERDDLLQQKMEKDEQKMERDSSEVEANSQKLTELEEKLEQSKSEVEKLEEEMEEKSNTIKELKENVEEMEELRNSKTELETELEETKKKLSEIETSTEAAKAKENMADDEIAQIINDFSNSRDIQYENLASLKGQDDSVLSKLRTEIVTMIENFQEQLHKLKTMSTSLKNQLQQKNRIDVEFTPGSVLENVSDDGETDPAKLRELVLDMEKKYHEKIGELKFRDRRISVLAYEKEKIEKKIAAYEKEIEKVKLEVVAKNNELAGKDEELSAKDEVFGKKEEELQNEKKSHEIDLVEKSPADESLKKVIGEKNQTISVLKKMIRVRGGKNVEEMEKKMAELTDTIRELRSEVEKKTAEKPEEGKVVVVGEGNDLSEIVENLRSEIDHKNEIIYEKDKVILKLEKQLLTGEREDEVPVEIQKELDKLRIEKSELSEKLLQLQKRYKELTVKYQSMSTTETVERQRTKGKVLVENVFEDIMKTISGGGALDKNEEVQQLEVRNNELSEHIDELVVEKEKLQQQLESSYRKIEESKIKTKKRIAELEVKNMKESALGNGVGGENKMFENLRNKNVELMERIAEKERIISSQQRNVGEEDVSENINGLKKEIARLTKENRKMRKERGKLKNQGGGGNDDFLKAQRKIVKLERELESKVAVTGAPSSSDKKSVSVDKQEMYRMKSKILDLEETVIVKNKEIDRLVTEMDYVKVMATDESGEGEQIRQDVYEKLRSKVTEERDEKKKAVEKVKFLEEEVKKLSAENDLSKGSDQEDELQKDIQRYQKEVEALREKLRDSKQPVVVGDDDKSKLIRGLRAKIEDKETAIRGHSEMINKLREHIRFLELELDKRKPVGKFKGVYKSRRALIWVKPEFIEIQGVRCIHWQEIEAFVKNETGKYPVYFIELRSNEKLKIGITDNVKQFEKYFVEYMKNTEEDWKENEMSTPRLKKLFKEVKELRIIRDRVISENNVLRDELKYLKKKIREGDVATGRKRIDEDFLRKEKEINDKLVKYQVKQRSEKSEVHVRELQREIRQLQKKMKEGRPSETHEVFLCRYRKKYRNFIVKDDCFLIDDLVAVNYVDVESFQKKVGKTKTQYKIQVNKLGLLKVNMAEKREMFEEIMMRKVRPPKFV